MDNKVHVTKILEALKEKLEALESCSDNISNGIESMKWCMKEWKDIVKKKMIKEDNEIKVQPLSSLSEEEVVKRPMIDNKDNEINVGFGVLTVKKVEFDEKRLRG